MSDFQLQMNQVVQTFVSQISELARKAAVDTLQLAFTQSSGRATSRGASSPTVRAGRPPGGKGVKRTQADLDALAERVISFVKSKPGLRIEQINKELGTTTKDLALPIRKMVADGYLSAKGQKRSTTYHAGRKTWKASAST